MPDETTAQPRSIRFTDAQLEVARLQHDALTTELTSALGSIRGVVLEERDVREHVLRPAYLDDVVSSRGLEEGTPFLDLRAHIGIPHRLDVDDFGNALHAALKDSTEGYVMQLRQHGTAIWTLEWNWAKGPGDGSEGWTPDVRMHVASVSKLITAMAMTKLLAAHGISADTPIIGYLPVYWATGPHVGDVTFAHLMTHTSGFVTGTSSSDYPFMKAQVAAGSTGTGSYHYENMNFGLCRILLATIDGAISTGADFAHLPFLPDLNDPIWDAATTGAYRAYVETNIFAAACVIGTLTHPGDDALAYGFPTAGTGWNSGDLTTMAGGAGWHLSVDDLLAVMNDFRRVGNIVSSAAAQGMLDDSFGIDLVQATPAGTLYNKNGLWQNGAAQVEQSLAYFLPQDMELVVLANSAVGSPAQFFRDVVTTLYVDNLHPIFDLPRLTEIVADHPIRRAVTTP